MNSSLGTEESENRPGTLAARLRAAIDEAGGPTRVARLADLSINNLNRWLAAKNDIKSADLVRLADVMDLSVEWLAAGRGEMRRQPPIPPQPAQPAPAPDAAQIIDLQRFSKALEMTMLAFNDRDGPRNWAHVARLTLTIYDALLDPTVEHQQLARVLSAPFAAPKPDGA